MRRYLICFLYDIRLVIRKHMEERYKIWKYNPWKIMATEVVYHFICNLLNRQISRQFVLYTLSHCCRISGRQRDDYTNLHAASGREICLGTIVSLDRWYLSGGWWLIQQPHGVRPCIKLQMNDPADVSFDQSPSTKKAKGRGLTLLVRAVCSNSTSVHGGRAVHKPHMHWKDEE